MKKLFLVASILFCAFVSCAEEPAVPATFVVFDNTRGICPAVVYSDYRRNAADKIAEVPAGKRSDPIECRPGDVTFFFEYPVTIKGIADLTVPYVPTDAGKNQESVRVDANRTTSVSIPKLDETLSSRYVLLSSEVYLFIRNDAARSIRLFLGGAEKKPDGSDSAFVNPGERVRYTISPGAASGYQLMVSGDFRPLPNPPANFESGHVYSFVYTAGGGVTLLSDVAIQLGNADIAFSSGSWGNPLPLSIHTWTNDSITASTAGGEIWYSFTVTKGTAYSLWWNDSKQGNATKTLDIKAGAEYSSNGTTIFTGEDSAWTSPQTFTAAASGTVKIRVSPYAAGRIGTYGIAYSTTANVVTFNANGGAFSDGSDTAAKNVPLKQAAGALPTPPVRAGYTFAGWSTSTSGAVNFTASTIVSASLTVYAQWMVHTYTVTFDNNGGSGVNPTTKTVTYPATTVDVLPTEPARTGYTFTGWNTAQDGSGTTFTADYSFNTAASGGALTIYAQWTAIAYTIVYDKNAEDATGAMEDAAHTYAVSKALTTNGYTRTGYTFGGWNTAANGTGTNYADGASVQNLRTTAGSVTLYAQWKVNQYTVTFDNNGGTGVNPATKTVTYPATEIDALPTEPARTGYTFTSWNTAANGSGTAFTVDYSFNTADSGGTLTAYAQWIPITYTIVYNKNATDATGTMAASTHTYAVSKSLTANGYTRTGYVFAGWNTAANGTGTSYAAGASVLNLRDTEGSATLYAQWSLNTYTVTFNNNGGSGVNPTTKNVIYPATKIDALPTPPTRSGYVFAGWNTAANGSGTAFSSAYSFNTAASSGTMTVYARWVSAVTRTIPGSSITLSMVLIPAGTFMMGSPAAEADRDPVRETQHSVTLTKGFYTGIYAVTQEQYRAVMTGNANGLSASPSSFSSNPAAGETQAKRPVENINWYAAIVFCNRLSILEGLTPVYSKSTSSSVSGNRVSAPTIITSTNPSNWGAAPTSSNATWNAITASGTANGYRLSTEAEWEYACRAGAATAYSFGESVNGDYVWYGGNSDSITHETGKRLPNIWGLYDMHGNVYEWVWDWYADFTAAAATDPRGASSSTWRVRKGTAIYDQAARSAGRSRVVPSTQDGATGFRIVRNQ